MEVEAQDGEEGINPAEEEVDINLEDPARFMLLPQRSRQASEDTKCEKTSRWLKIQRLR